ncbi:MAG: CARDB domain-containing protein [Promethearchaeota archaeon]
MTLIEFSFKRVKMFKAQKKANLYAILIILIVFMPFTAMGYMVFGNSGNISLMASDGAIKNPNHINIDSNGVNAIPIERRLEELGLPEIWFDHFNEKNSTAEVFDPTKYDTFVFNALDNRETIVNSDEILFNLNNSPNAGSKQSGGGNGGDLAISGGQLLDPPEFGILGTNMWNESLTTGTKSVFGSDDRTKITDTTEFPYRTVVKLYMTFGGNNYIGSGAMIDGKHVLTAGHCVYDSEHGWAESITIVPAKNGPTQPFGSASWTRLRTLRGWVNDQSSEYDLAVITLDKDYGTSIGWMGRITRDPDSSLYSGTIHTAGYPGDLDSGEYMYYCSSQNGWADENNHFFYLDVMGGQSGSPTWTIYNSDPYILSVVAYSSTYYNFGTRLNRYNYFLINNWLEADAGGVDKPDLWHNEFGSASIDDTMIGFDDRTLGITLDINNLGTADANNVEVFYYASTNDIISTSDYFIGKDTLAGTIVYQWCVTSWYYAEFDPAIIPSGNYYIGYIIDKDSKIDEFDEDNNKGLVSTQRVLVDFEYPENPTYCSVTNYFIDNNTWTNKWDPEFLWDGAYDYYSGIAGYYCYFGTTPNGTSYYLTSENSYTENVYTDGTYYLRISTKDKADNCANFTTLFVYKYDGTPPENPTSCDQVLGDTQSNIAQSKVSDPIFVWEDANDSSSGIKGYYVYFGPNSDGYSYYFTQDNKYYADPLTSSGTYYLRVNTLDNAGNEAGWTTLYVFIYKKPISVGLILMLSIGGVAGAIGSFLMLKYVKKRRGSRTFDNIFPDKSDGDDSISYSDTEEKDYAEFFGNTEFMDFTEYENNGPSNDSETTKPSENQQVDEYDWDDDWFS